METTSPRTTNLPACDTRVVMLLYKYHPVFTGAGVAARRLAQGLMKQGISTWVVTKRFSDLPAEEWIDGVRVKHLPAFQNIRIVKSILFDLLAALYLWRHRREFDILHIHSCTLASFLPIGTARLLGKGIVLKMTLLGGDDPVSLQRSRFGFLYRLSYSMADRIISTTEALKRSYLSSGLDPQRVVSVKQGVDVQVFRPVEDKRVIRAELGLSPEGVYLCSVGAVTPRKGTDLLLKVFEYVADRREGVMLLVVGKWDFEGHPGDAEHHQAYVSTVFAEIRSKGLQKRVIFTGLVPNVNEYLQASDVFVFPSRGEGSPSAVVEAMATGLPCVVSGLSGISQELVGREGIIVEDENPLSFAQAILRLLADPSGARALGRRARQRAVEIYSFAGTVSCYVDLYQDLMAMQRTGRCES